MDDAYYEQILDKSLDKFISLVEEKNRIEDELEKMRQFAHATINLLSDEAAARYEEKWKPFTDKLVSRVTSLRDSIKNILIKSYPAKLTAAQMRDKLRAEGFDFSSYKSDPLPSVSTTLRRLREDGVIGYEDFEGVTVYQAKPPAPPSGALANAMKDEPRLK